MIKLFHVWPVRTLYSYYLGPCDMIPFFFFNAFLLLRIARCSRLTFYLHFPIPGVSYLSKEPWFLLIDNGIRDQALGLRYDHCY